MCDCHRTSTHEQPTHLGFHLIHCCTANTTSSHHPQRSCSGREQIWFLEVVFAIAQSASSSCSSCPIYHFVDHAWRLVAYTVNSVSLCVVFRNLLLLRKSGMCIQLLNLVLHIEHVDMCRYDILR
jgi:hypothetical protein